MPFPISAIHRAEALGRICTLVVLGVGWLIGCAGLLEFALFTVAAS